MSIPCSVLYIFSKFKIVAWWYLWISNVIGSNIITRKKPFERRILCFQSWCMINISLANCVWQAGEILTCHDGWKVSDLILRRYYWYRKKGRVNFTATWAKESTELFCSNLSILCRRWSVVVDPFNSYKQGFCAQMSYLAPGPLVSFLDLE